MERPSFKETLAVIGGLATTIYIAKEVSVRAFSRPSRNEVLERSDYTCEGIDDLPCIWTVVDGEAASRERGHFLMASHKDHTRNENYDNPDNGKSNCKCCHMMHHQDMDDTLPVHLLDNKTMYHTTAMKRPQQHMGIYENIRLVEDVFEIAMRLESRPEPDMQRMAELAGDTLNTLDPERYRDFVENRDSEKLSSLRAALSGGSRRRV